MKRGLLLALLVAAAYAHAEDGIVYGHAGGQKLTMDYYPAAGKGPHPAVIIIHGGAFTHGTSKSDSEAYCADFLAPAGYAVFSINYRLAPKAPLSAMVDDVETAVRFVRRNAKKWDADPARIALLGGSAGGYLSNMVGLAGKDDSAVQAVVTLFGVSDLPTMPPPLEWMKPVLGEAAMKKGFDAALADASPIRHVRSGAPPFLLIHGDKDNMVPFDQSTRFQAALREEGVRCDLLTIPNGPHATGTWHQIPGAPDWERQTAEWLNATLKHSGPIGQGIRARTAALAIPAGFTPIFDGKDLNGWHISKVSHHGNSHAWKVENGAITATQDKPGNGGILLTDKRYRDFEVYLEMNPDWGCDSGLFLRSDEKGDAYQVTLDYLPGGSLGAIYGEGLKGVNGGKPPDWQSHFKKGEWNSVRARITGDVPHITVWMNGDQITDFTDTANHSADGATDGMIALQIHGGDRCKPGLYHRFRNIGIRELQ